jgi:hypothetical protein
VEVVRKPEVASHRLRVRTEMSPLILHRCRCVLLLRDPSGWTMRQNLKKVLQ